jgi:hypothetical protein
MATRKFRLEFIREVMECSEEDRIPKGYDHNAAHEDFDIIFRSKDDGKYYAFYYNYNGDHGIDRFDGWKADDLVEAWEVEKKQVTTTTWVKV